MVDQYKRVQGEQMPLHLANKEAMERSRTSREEMQELAVAAAQGVMNAGQRVVGKRQQKNLRGPVK